MGFLAMMALARTLADLELDEMGSFAKNIPLKHTIIISDTSLAYYFREDLKARA
jgi:hypothetical protein